MINRLRKQAVKASSKLVVTAHYNAGCSRYPKHTQADPEGSRVLWNASRVYLR